MPKGRPLPFILTTWLLGGCGAHAPARRELAVPDVKQATPYTCSAAALQAVLAYYGLPLREDELAAELGAAPKTGAPPSAIVRVAKAHGLVAEFKTGTSLDALRAALGREEPVIIAVQARPSAPPSSYRDDWDDGHYVVVIGVTGDRLILEDPRRLGSRAQLRLDELSTRWHDEDGGVRTERGAIFFSGRPPSPPPTVVHLE